MCPKSLWKRCAEVEKRRKINGGLYSGSALPALKNKRPARWSNHLRRGPGQQRGVAFPSLAVWPIRAPFPVWSLARRILSHADIFFNLEVFPRDALATFMRSAFCWTAFNSVSLNFHR